MVKFSCYSLTVMKRSLLVLAVILGLSAFSFAETHCDRGSNPADAALWDGFHVQMAPDSDHPEQCHAALLGADGKAVFEANAPEMWMLPVSGQDINADEKRDVVLETVSKSPCCFRYYILTPGASPVLVRDVTTTPRLTFEERDGSGRIDISTHELIYAGIDGLDRDVSPMPLVVLRMRGSSFYPVSQVYWADYQRDIEQAKMGVPQSAFDKFFGKPNGGDDKPKEPSPEERRAIDHAKTAVLTIYLDQLYGGRPQEAMKTLMEMWPDRDKDRIRQIILGLRMRGIMGEINRQATQAANPPAVTP